jgi:hypothetical protein
MAVLAPRAKKGAGRLLGAQRNAVFGALVGKILQTGGFWGRGRGAEGGAIGVGLVPPRADGRLDPAELEGRFNVVGPGWSRLWQY